LTRGEQKHDKIHEEIEAFKKIRDGNKIQGNLKSVKKVGEEIEKIINGVNKKVIKALIKSTQSSISEKDINKILQVDPLDSSDLQLPLDGNCKRLFLIL
jgi:hypothetical protein